MIADDPLVEYTDLSQNFGYSERSETPSCDRNSSVPTDVEDHWGTRPGRVNWPEKKSENFPCSTRKPSTFIADFPWLCLTLWCITYSITIYFMAVRLCLTCSWNISHENCFSHGSLNVPIGHHPTIRYMVYNGYYKVMSNIPKMGHLPTPVSCEEKSRTLFTVGLIKTTVWDTGPGRPLSWRMLGADTSFPWPQGTKCILMLELNYFHLLSLSTQQYFHHLRSKWFKWCLAPQKHLIFIAKSVSEINL